MKAGVWLIVADPLQPAEAIVVLGGGIPFRAMEAAAVYRGGWAQEVWLTQGDSLAKNESSSDVEVNHVADYVYSQRVLERRGVPSGVIHLIPGRTRNTVEELRVVAQRLSETQGRRVILVTSRFHTRRVRTIWRVTIGSSLEAVVRPTEEDPFQPERWWVRADDTKNVVREWSALLNVWSGFPVRSERW